MFHVLLKLFQRLRENPKERIDAIKIRSMEFRPNIFFRIFEWNCIIWDKKYFINLTYQLCELSLHKIYL